MNGKQKAILASIICGLVTLLVWLITPDVAEPEYKGKSYTEWLEMFVENSPSPPGQPAARTAPPDLQKLSEAEDAIKQIGTAAVPILIKLISNENSIPQQLTGSMLSRIARHQMAWHEPEVKRKIALLGFSALRSDPGPAVPALIELLSHEHIKVRVQAASALATIGPQAHAAVPVLIGGLNENGVHDPAVVIATIRALGEIRTNAETVVPLLLEYVAGTRYDGKYWQAALSAINRFGELAAYAAPQLGRIAETTDNESLKEEITTTVQKIFLKPSESVQPPVGFPAN